MLSKIQNRLYLLIVVLLMFFSKVHAQFTPYFKNYLLSEYRAGNQNWGVTKAENGKVYVANNKGLLEYDGLKWDFKQLPNKTTIRSVLAVNDRIYVGSFEEFGFWETNGKGELFYTPLSDSIKDGISSNEEIWQIIPLKDIIVFRSFFNVYLYHPSGKIDKLNVNSTLISCNVVDGSLLVSTLNKGVFKLFENELKPFIGSQVLNGSKIVSITKFNSDLLINTALKGSFLYRNNNLVSTHFEINNYIKQHQLNEFSVLENGNMIFGTIKDGVYFTDNLGDVIFHLNKENGLVNNTVLSQFVDADNGLWLGLDNGIAYVDLNSSYYFFNDITGKLGAVYDVIDFNGRIYVGSNTGLFYLNDSNKLQFVKGSQGQVWYLKEIDGDLFCGHNDGTFLIENDALVPISNHTGGWTIKKVPEHNNIYIEGTYAGLVRFKKENGKWTDKHLGKTTMPIRFLVFENQNTAWAAHAYKGFYKIKFDENFDSITRIENYNDKGVFSDFNVRVYKIKNDICLKTNDGWLKYEPLIDSIVPYNLLNETFGVNSYLISEENEDEIVLKGNNDAIGFKALLDGENDIWLSNNYFENRLNVGNENVSKIADSTFALNLMDGFMIVDNKRGAGSISRLYTPKIEQIEIDKELMELSSSKPNFDAGINSSIGISVSSPKSSGHFFEYSIKETDSALWKKMDGNRLNLSNLNDGTYTVLIRSGNYLGDKSKPLSLKLNVLPPWYKGTLGMVLFVALFALVMTGFYLYNKRKTKLEQRLLKIKYAKEQRELLREKTLENEKRIVQLKNESLKNEVKLKSKQLANTAMALVKKNETLQELKKELTTVRDNFDNHYLYKKIINKVDHSIEHKDEWEIFEHNFNQVHEDFFRILKSKHPKLTHKDLKICAYIKMNLANKEIAPLMNVSVRGLETHRYRLKKKLNLENDISVSTYLINLE